MKVFTPEQEEIIQHRKSGMDIMAGAGSGKTTTVVAKCVRLLEIKHQARFVAVSFTERSASDLKVKLAQVLALSPHWIMTIHGLCAAIIREFPKEAGFDGEETILTEAETQLFWERALESLWMDDLPDDVRVSVESLLSRESRGSLTDLLKRVRELSSLGVFRFLKSSEHPDTQSLEIAARFVLEKYNRMKRRQGYLDFSDLELGADRALAVATVRDTYHSRFDLVLVDEFQDTNPLQAQLIRQLAKPDASNLCVVGDPKQSIYRFRDADVSVFEDFCMQLPHRKSLTWNFRSVSGIIDFTNQVCEPNFAASQMKFEALISKRESNTQQSSVLRLNIESPSDLCQWLLQEVQRGVHLGEFALLLRKIRGNEKWLKAFSSAGIPIAVGGGGLFWEDPRVRELVAFLRWWDHPANALSGGVFLRAPWVGISDALLDQWVQVDSTWREPFFGSNHPLAQKLKSCSHQILRPGELLLSLLIDEEIENELGAPLMGLWHRVEELSSRGLDFHSVVLDLSSAIRENRREREVPAPRSHGQLPVLTLHGAKGLEFNQVILVDFSGPSRTPDAPLLFWDRIQGVYLAGRDPSGDRNRTDRVEKIWRESEKEKNLAESKRLFYVALTRARDRLILVCPSSDSEEAVDAPYLRDDWKAWIQSGTRIETSQIGNSTLGLPESTGSDSVATLVPCSRSQKVPIQSLRKRPRHSVTEWNLLSRCPRAYEWTTIRPKAFDLFVHPVGDPEVTIEEAARVAGDELSKRDGFQELGNRVHSCLASGDFEGLKVLETESHLPAFSAAPLIRWATGSPWMLPANPEIGRDVWSELPFEVPIGKEVLVGSMDRLVAERQGDRTDYVIIDFKVTEKFKSVEALLESYQTQIHLYALALQRLNPEIHIGEIDARLVNITAGGVQVVSVPLGESLNYQRLHLLAESANQILNGTLGLPLTGPLCRFCEFRPHCPEGIRSLL